jgi:hypothetical protein
MHQVLRECPTHACFVHHINKWLNDAATSIETAEKLVNLFCQSSHSELKEARIPTTFWHYLVELVVGVPYDDPRLLHLVDLLLLLQGRGLEIQTIDTVLCDVFFETMDDKLELIPEQRYWTEKEFTSLNSFTPWS